MGNLLFKQDIPSLSLEQRTKIQGLSQQTQDIEFYADVTQKLFSDFKIQYGTIYVWHVYSLQIKQNLPESQHNELDSIYKYWLNVFKKHSADISDVLTVIKREWENKSGCSQPRPRDIEDPCS